MKSFGIVFRAIKENCGYGIVTGEGCFDAFEKLGASGQLFLPLYLHLEVLSGLGLIVFSLPKQEIKLTPKGVHTDFAAIPVGYIYGLTVLYLTRYVVVLILFWPFMLFMKAPGAEGERKNSAG